MKIIYITEYFLRPVLIALLLLYSHISLSQWNESLHREDITVYNKPAINGVGYYKAETIFDVSFDSLYAFFMNFEDYPKWVNYCSYTDVLKGNTDSLFIIYSYYDLPWPFSDRDAITELRIDFDTSNRIVVNSVSGETLMPELKNVIRLKGFEEKFLLEEIDGNNTRFVMEGKYIPGGLVPNWMIDRAVKYGPYDVLMKVKILVE